MKANNRIESFEVIFNNDFMFEVKLSGNTYEGWHTQDGGIQLYRRIKGNRRRRVLDGGFRHTFILNALRLLQ